ncbi:MAG: hypothetical protein VW268_10545 [Rhodospirillaceae bacterium]
MWLRLSFKKANHAAKFVAAEKAASGEPLMRCRGDPDWVEEWSDRRKHNSNDPLQMERRRGRDRRASRR